MPELGRIDRVEAWALRAPIDVPVVTSFGTMRDRPAVFVRLTGDDGVQGWGEVWCNFPGVGAEHRARLLIDTVAPLLSGRHWGEITELFDELERRLAVLALQTGEPGPLAQVCSAIDVAAWDLAARRMGLPLWQLLGGASGSARVYASGLHPSEAIATALRMHDLGHRAFKMKVGFDADADARRLAELRAVLGDDAALMVDANQAWTTTNAAGCIDKLADAHPIWIEEPLRADRGPQEWAELARRSPLPLAAGENLRGAEAFAAMQPHLAFVQPDLGKWGGLSAGMAIARHAEAAGSTYCPHWLGGPLGLLASMHARAALGEAGYVEWDANVNPLHRRFADQLPPIGEGRIALGHEPGLGLHIEIDALADLVTWSGALPP